MDSNHSEPSAALEGRLKRWRKDHVQGDWQVVIKPRVRSGPVPLNEFGSTRLTFQHAVNELEDMLAASLHHELARAADEVGNLGMPAQDASRQFETLSSQGVAGHVERFRREIIGLRVAVKERWDESEYPFSEDEMLAFGERFESVARRLSEQHETAFRTRVWSRVGSNEPPFEANDNDARSARRRAFVEPVLNAKGWTPHKLAVEAEVDKNTVLHYLDGATKRPNPDSLRSIANALGVDPLRMPR